MRASAVVSHARASSSLSPVPVPNKVKKPKRAETRPCPACSELIPLRLLAAHAELEMQRVQDIIGHIGDAEVLAEVNDLEEGPSASKRRSALKARQSLTALQPLPRVRASSSTPPVTLLAHSATTTPAAIEHTIGYLGRRRKARHARLKELAKEDAIWLSQRDVGGAAGAEEEIACPVCLRPVRGDRDVVDAHVDACLAYERRRVDVEWERGRSNGTAHENEDTVVDVDMGVDPGLDGARGENVRSRVITNAGLRGTGIRIRPSTVDTEDDVDIDGTDDAMFGDAQFGEADVVEVESEPDADMDGGRLSNRDRQTEAATPTDVSSSSQTRHLDEDMDKLDLAIANARSRGDALALATALEAKLEAIPAPATCRICLSPYVDPTVSTGCWHTCCATCWLKCLGATKLCPMCQRITGASELRRIYL